jgi:hypothetical protein
VRLRAMNSQGWSQLSSPFQFRTAGTNSQGTMQRTLYPLTIRTEGADSHGWNQLYIYLASRTRQGVPSQLLNTFQFRRTGTKSRSRANAPTSYCSEQKRRKARDQAQLSPSPYSSEQQVPRARQSQFSIILQFNSR